MPSFYFLDVPLAFVWNCKSVRKVDCKLCCLCHSELVEEYQRFTDGLYAILRDPYSALPHRKPLLIFFTQGMVDCAQGDRTA